MKTKNDKDVNEKRDNALLKAKTVTVLLDISSRTLWRRVASGDLPKPIYLVPRLPRWDPNEIQQVIDRKRGQR